MDKRNKAVITITTFRGISSDATHFYGHICVYNEHCDILWSYKCTRMLTQKDINKHPDRFYSFNPGEFTEVFDSWKDVILSAKESINKNFSHKQILVEGIPNVDICTIDEALNSNFDNRPS